MTLSKSTNSSTSKTVLKNMTVLAFGATSAKAVGLMSMVVIARLYTPEHLGVLSVFLSFVLLTAPFLTLRLPVALPLPKSDAMAANLASATLALTTLSLFVITTSLLCAKDWLFSALNIPSLSLYVPFLALGMLTTSLYEVLSLWSTRKRNFKIIAKTQITQTITGAALKISLGLIGLKPLGLLIGQITQQGGGIFSMTLAFRSDLKKNLNKIRIKRMLAALKRYKDIPVYRLPSQILLAFSTQAPLLFFSFHFGASTTGQLSLALTALATPIFLLANTTGNAYFSEISRIGNKNPSEILTITKTIFKHLATMAIAPCLAIAILGPWIFQTLFGSEWKESGQFAQILSFYLFFQFTSSPLVNALTVFNKQNLFLKINVARSLLIIITFAASYFLNLNSIVTLMAYSALLATHYGLTTITVFTVIRSSSN